MVFILSYMHYDFYLWPRIFRSADTTVRMFDRRKLTSGAVGSPLHIFEGHKAAVLCVQASSNLVFLLNLLFLNYANCL